MRQIGWIMAVAAAGVAAIACAWAMANGEYFRSPVRLAAYVVIPAAVALTGAACLLAGARARALFATYTLSAGAALIAVELFLEWRGAPAAQVLGAAGETRRHDAAHAASGAERAYPHLCAAMVPARNQGGTIVSPISVDGVPVQVLTGLARNRLALDAAPSRADRRTDAQGFNNPPDEWRPGEVRALVVGDSFAFGVGAPLGAGFVDRMRARIGTTVNLGCGGNGPLSALAGLVEYGRVLRPRIVVWAYFEGNDLPKDLARESETALLPRYLDARFDQNLFARRHAIDAAVERYLQARAASGQQPKPNAKPPSISLANAARLENLRTALGLVYAYKRSELPAFARVLARAKEETAAWGGTLVFAYIPGEARYGSAVARWDADGYKRGVLEAARSLGLATVDFDAEFRRRAAEPRRLFAGHFTPEGHMLAGDILAEALRPLLPPE